MSLAQIAGPNVNMWLRYRPSRGQTLEYCLYCGSGRVARSNRDRWCRADFLEPDGDHLAVRDRVHRHPIVILILIARARQLGSNHGAPVLDQQLRLVDQPTRSIDYLSRLINQATALLANHSPAPDSRSGASCTRPAFAYRGQSPISSACRSAPQRRLFPVASPMPGTDVAHGIKARLMLSW